MTSRAAAPSAFVALLDVKYSSSAILFLALLIGGVLAGSRLLNDPDTMWHVATGSWIWLHSGVPWTDPFSHTMAGATWIAKEWLSQMLLFRAYAALGWTGVVVLTAAAIAVAFAGIHAWLSDRLTPLSAAMTILIAMALATSHVLARPHTLVLPIIVLWFATLVGSLERRRAPPPILAGAMIVWANMHASFPFGLVGAGLLGLEGLMNAPAGQRRAVARGWALFMALAAGATMVSPYGWHEMAVPLQMSGRTPLLLFVNEWRPLTLDIIGCLALLSLGAVALCLLRQPRQNIVRILFVAMLGTMMVRHARFISLFAIIAPIVAARSLPSLGEARPLLPARIALAAIPTLAALAIAAVVFIRPEPDAAIAPREALNAAMRAELTGPVFNDYDFGGFLIQNGVPTFVDGRTELYFGDFLPALVRAQTDENGAAFSSLMKRYRVGWALVRTGSNDARLLAGLAGWSQIYTDDTATVFTAKPTADIKRS